MSGEELGTPGAALAKARESAGITQREVADALHLPITTIDAIEVGDRTRLPAQVFTRGYVRAYAKLLELDPDPLIAALEADQGENETVAASVEETMPGLDAPASNSLAALARQPRVVLAGAGGIAVLVILATLLFGGEDEAAAPAGVVDASAQPRVAESAPTQTTPAQTMTQVDDPSETLAAVETSDDVVADVVDEAEPAVAAEEMTDVAGEAGATVSEPELSVPASAAAILVGDPNLRRLTPAGSDRLSLVFSEDCWVEIKDTEGNQLYGNLGRAGDSLEFVGAGPFRVLLGYAPGAILLYNEEPIALSPHTRNNVASLVIGQ